jgi:hypothetical protein
MNNVSPCLCPYRQVCAKKSEEPKNIVRIIFFLLYNFQKNKKNKQFGCLFFYNYLFINGLYSKFIY